MQPRTDTPAVVVWLDRKLPEGRSARIDGMWRFCFVVADILVDTFIQSRRPKRVGLPNIMMAI